MAAEGVALSDPHRDGVKDPAEQLQDVVPRVATHSHKKNKRPSHRSVAAPAVATKTNKPPHVTSEKTPLVLKIDTSRQSQSVEDVHPLPWFRSPEWSRQSPVLAASDRNRDRAADVRYKQHRNTAAASPRASWWCFGASNSTTTTRSRDVELGINSRSSSRHRRVLATTTNDTDGFRQCVQFIVALVIVVALALIFMVIFEPFQESSATAAATAVADSDGDGGW